MLCPLKIALKNKFGFGQRKAKINDSHQPCIVEGFKGSLSKRSIIHNRDVDLQETWKASKMKLCGIQLFLRIHEELVKDLYQIQNTMDSQVS